MTIDIAEKQVVEGIYATDREAISRAEYLHGLGKYKSVRVYADDGESKLIFDRKYALSGKLAVIRPVSDVFYCQSILDVYRYESRATLLKMMRNYFDDKAIIPSELLHNARLLMDLARDDRFVGSVCTRLGTAQAAACGDTPAVRKAALQAFLGDIIRLAENAGELAPLYERCFREGLSDVLEHVDRERSFEERDRIVTYIIARRFESMRDWNQKVLSAYDMVSESQSKSAEQCLDEVLAEIVDGVLPIKALIGAAPDLHSALESMSLVLDGSLSEKNCQTNALMALNNIMGATLMPRVQEAILNRMSFSISGTVPLTRRGRVEDQALFRELISQCQRFEVFVGGSPMSEAITLRAKTLLGSQAVDLTIEEAIGAILPLLRNAGTGVTYLLELLPSKTGTRHATLIVDKAISLLDSFRSADDLARVSKAFAADESERWGLRKRLLAAGISRKLVMHFAGRLAEVLQKDQKAEGNPEKQSTRPDNDRLEEKPAERGGAEGGGEAALVRTVAGSQRPDAPGDERACLVISLLDGVKEWRLGKQQPKMTVGRSESCEISLNDPRVSRIHGYFIWTPDGFAYVDQSTNGSFVFLRDKVRKIHKSGIILDANGVMFIGEPPLEGSQDVKITLKFKLTSA